MIGLKKSATYGRFGALGPRRAFTLIELLTVIAIIGLLAGMLLPVLAAARARSRTTACASNFRQFGHALQMYSGDFRDYLPPNPDGNEETRGRPKWVEGWLGLPGPDCTNLLFLRESLVAPYLDRQTVPWQCPSSRDPVVIAETRMPRVRTISMNGFLGNPVKSPAATTWNRFGDIGSPGPSSLLTFFDERVETINDGSFAMQWDFNPAVSSRWILRDKPGIRHRRGANAAFADGHVEWRGWLDPRTIEAPRNDAAMPGNMDILWMQERATSRPGLATP